MKVLLINPPVIEENGLDASTIPLGLLFIRQVLINAGFDVECINLYKFSSWESIKQFISGMMFSLVGIPCYTTQRNSVIKLAALCKETNPSAHIVLGGPHATFLHIELLHRYSFVDFIIRSEGEMTFLELCQCLATGKQDFEKIRGLSYKKGAKVYANIDQDPLNLKELPIINFTKQDIEGFDDCGSLTFHFEDFLKFGESRQIAPVLTSRGCDHNCNFCCNGQYWGRQRYHDGKKVIQQIVQLYDNYNIRLFDFYDDNFMANKEQVKEICKGIIEHKLQIHWWCSARVLDADAELLNLMKTAGCFMISYGVESGSQLMLNRMRKGITKEQIYSAFELTKAAQIQTRCTITIGNDGESFETVEETIDLLISLKPKQIAIYTIDLYPGTPLYKECIRKGFIEDDYWFENQGIPTYNFNTNQATLNEYKKSVLARLEKNIQSKYECDSTSIELDMRWSDKNEKLF